VIDYYVRDVGYVREEASYSGPPSPSYKGGYKVFKCQGVATYKDVAELGDDEDLLGCFIGLLMERLIFISKDTSLNAEEKMEKVFDYIFSLLLTLGCLSVSLHFEPKVERVETFLERIRDTFKEQSLENLRPRAFISERCLEKAFEVTAKLRLPAQIFEELGLKPGDPVRLKYDIMRGKWYISGIQGE